LVGGVWGIDNACKAFQGIVDVMTEGAGGVEGQAGMKKSTKYCHFVYIMKEMMREKKKIDEKTQDYIPNDSCYVGL
jgi:hypothetical protein